MWKQLCQVKESKGRLGILAARRGLYRMKAEEGCDMVEHISSMRRLQEELHMMESLVSDEDFVILLITSLPESWDNYTSSFLGASGNKPALSSHEFIANLIEEDKRRKGWNENAGTAMQAGKKKGQAKKGGASGSGSGSSKECFNCHKKGHVKADCWGPGGGKEGQGPKGRNKTQQATEVNSSLNDVAYVVNADNASFAANDSSKLDWFADSCTTSHICTTREAFTTYTPLKNATVSGIGSNPAVTCGRGTITVNFAVDGKTMQHTLQNVLHVPEAPNCLLSIPRLDESGGWAEMKGGKCTLRDKTNRVIGYGWKVNRMYKLAARANLQTESAQRQYPFRHGLILGSEIRSVSRIKGHIEMLKNQGRKPRFMRFDNGAELINSELENMARQEGIVVEPTAPYSPSQNGVAERFNRTLLELARAMLIEKSLPLFLWDEAVRHAAYLRNRAPTRALDGMTPYEAWSGKKPSVEHFREFGCDVWVLDESKSRSKLLPKSHKMVFVGFMDGSKSIRYYDPKTRRVKVSRNVAFNENDELEELEIVELPGSRSEGEHRDDSDTRTNPEPPPEEPPAQSEPIPAEVEEGSRNLRTRTTTIDYKKIGNPQSRTPGQRHANKAPDVTRPTEASKAKQRTVENTSVAVEEVVEEILQEKAFISDGNWSELPQTYEEAMASDEAPQWKKAMDNEMENVLKMGTWELGNLPDDREVNLMGCRWVFAKKKGEHAVKFKGRIVAQGCSQQPGMDYSPKGTFSPVFRLETFRGILAKTAVENWKLRQFDIVGAYLHGRLKETIYMKQPPGYNDGTGRVCILKRSLYGLKQAGNVWNHELNDTLVKIDFKRLKSDYCCYVRRKKDGLTIMVVWVDDIISASTDDDLNDQLEADLGRYFEVKSLGKPSMILGMKLQQYDHKIQLSQSHYIDEILKKFNFEDIQPTSTPMDKQINLDDPRHLGKSINEGELYSKPRFTFAVGTGTLMWLALATRPDIAFSLAKIAQYAADPKTQHWNALKRIFRYLKATKDLALTWGGEDHLLHDELQVFADADYANNYDRKSFSGYVILMAGGAIAWSAKKQATVAHSTPEAEYIAATHVAKQVLWQRSIFQELNFHISTPTTIFSDNKAAISIAHHLEFFSRTKHIDIACHFIRDYVQRGDLTLVYVQSAQNLADLFTKPLNRSIHQDLTYRIGVISKQGEVL
ncbi:hypothetical protein MD484_g6523, partial [Candolleomyces efflorescens]